MTRLIIILAAVSLSLFLAFTAGRNEVLSCADRIHEYDPRPVREICGSIMEVFQ